MLIYMKRKVYSLETDYLLILSMLPTKREALAHSALYGIFLSVD